MTHNQDIIFLPQKLSAFVYYSKMYLWISKKVSVCPEVNVKFKIHIPVHDSWKYMYFPKPWQELKSHEVIILGFWITAFPLWSENKRIDRRTQSWCETATPLLNYNHGKCDSGLIEMSIIMYQTVVKARIKSLVKATKILLSCNSDVDWACCFSFINYLFQIILKEISNRW